LGYVFYFYKKWKQTRSRFTVHSKGIILISPQTRKLKSIIKKIKKKLNVSLNNTPYELISKLNLILSKWAKYFNLGNCIYHRNFLKTWMHQAIWRWIYQKHKKWGKTRSALYYFLRKNNRLIPFEKKDKNYVNEKFSFFKGSKWVFWGTKKISVLSSNLYFIRIYNYLYNITEKKFAISACNFNVPQMFKLVHNYHFQRLQLINWNVKTNFKSLNVFSNRILWLYKKQKSLCGICKKKIDKDDVIHKFFSFEFVTPLYLGGSFRSIDNMILIHKNCSWKNKLNLR
jgi:hypothetical protein